MTLVEQTDEYVGRNRVCTWQAQLLKMTVEGSILEMFQVINLNSYFWEVRSWGFSGAADNIYLLKVNNTNTKKKV